MITTTTRPYSALFYSTSSCHNPFSPKHQKLLESSREIKQEPSPNSAESSTESKHTETKVERNRDTSSRSDTNREVDTNRASDRSTLQIENWSTLKKKGKQAPWGDGDPSASPPSWKV
mmetsp:Transcript_13321/g.36816  ORF Transcript_13321/g.36816 Transcript_13321/m.36816 type:complete len:118 (-) Transcript_13321:313-666(-)